jgi:hypothetical protein
MQVSIQLAAKVVYEARRSITTEIDAAQEEAFIGTVRVSGAPFAELTDAEREPLVAEVREALRSGTPMHDALGQAILVALR